MDVEQRSIWNDGLTGAGGSANSVPNKNPQLVTGTAVQIAAATFEQNLRMPGQFEDQETKKFYNYFRDYDSSIGRYSISDPIGLRGGSDTYGYVRGNPVLRRDAKGLSPEELPPPHDDYCTGLNQIGCLAKTLCGSIAALNAGSSGENRADAMRHCIWNCCMARLFGASVAETVASLHEERGGGPPASNAMDLCNNKHGRNCGRSWLGASCETCCDRSPLTTSPGAPGKDGSCR
jgi:RHS repeat-associated protein